MAQYDSEHVNQPGQYPADAFTLMGLPAQNFGSGAAGSAPPSTAVDEGSTNEPGQYPDRDDFTGVSYGGFQPPGTQGVDVAPPGSGGGPDTVTFDEPTLYKGPYTDGPFDQDGMGAKQDTVNAAVSGTADWTQANPVSYGGPPNLQMPGVAGNMPAGGDGHYQPGPDQDNTSHVMYGGWLKGQRPATDRHPNVSGPGT